MNVSKAVEQAQEDYKTLTARNQAVRESAAEKVTRDYFGYIPRGPGGGECRCKK